MFGRIGQSPLDIEHRSQRILKLRIAGLLSDEPFEQILGRFELTFSDFRGGQRVLIRRIVGPPAGGSCQRWFGIFQKIHLQAHAAEPEQNLRIIRLDLPGANPVGKRAFELALPLCNRGGLPQRSDRVRLQGERQIVGLERAHRVAVQQVRTAEIERQLVRRRAHMARVLEDVDRLVDGRVFGKQQRELDRPVLGNVGKMRPVPGQGGCLRAAAGLQKVGDEYEQPFGRLLERMKHRLRQLQ